MASRVHSRAGSRAPSNAPPPLVVDLGADQAPSREPIVMTLPTVERPPIYIDAPAPVVAPGLSGGRGMFKRLIVACDGMLVCSSFKITYPICVGYLENIGPLGMSLWTDVST
jgi:hypothetical protein